MKITKKIYLSTFVLGLIAITLVTELNLGIFNKSELNKEYDKFYPSDHELIKRTFPYYDYDLKAYPDAINELIILKAEQKLKKEKNNTLDIPWEFVGPTNIGGRIVDIEFNPQSPNIVYAAAATGGVFKSIDTGENWFPIFDDQPSLTIGDIGIDPNNPDIIYVGTGEANGGHNNFPGMGIYKSINAGQSWQLIGLDSTVSIGRIIIDPSNSQRVFVAAVGSYFKPNPERGVYISEDGGNSWQKSLFVSDSTGAIDLAINSSNPNIIYAAMWERVRRPIYRDDTHLNGPTGGIFKTVDGGLNWEKLGPLNGLPDPNSSTIGRIGLSISESNPSIIYATYNDGSNLTGIYKTTDDGENWIQTNNSFLGDGSFSWYFGQVRVHPGNPQTVFVLDVSLMKSTSSGETWDFGYGYSGPSQLHVDHHALAFHPNNSEYLISGNDGGINISQDGGATWSQPVKLPITQFYEIGLDHTNPARFYGGTQDNNTIRTLTGNDFDWESIYGGDGFYVIVDPNNPNIIYAESQFGGLGKSTNGGSSFNYARNGINSAEPTNWSTPVAMDPNNSDVLYYGTHTLYRTENGADVWEPISPQLTNYDETRRLGTITTIGIAETNSDVIYVGTDDGLVWVSSDYGNTWNNISSELPFRWVTRVVVDPTNENIVYVTFSGLRWADPEPKVFRSDDMGMTWTNISNGLPDAPANAFAVDYNNPDYLYLGNDIGAFVSKNAGKSWEVLGSGLPIVVVNDMKIHPEENYLVIGTHGRGMYKMDLFEVVGIDHKQENLPRAFELMQNYPNPFNPTTTIKYSIPASVVISNPLAGERSVSSKISPFSRNNNSNVELKIYDIIGREVATLVNQQQNPGTYNVSFDGSSLSSGVYFYQLKYADLVQLNKMVLIK